MAQASMRRGEAMNRPALSFTGIGIGIAIALLVTSKINADELADMLAPQFAYMEACKNIAPPLPPDRLRTIGALHEIVDEGELRKSISRLIVKLAGSKEKVAAFCPPWLR
jgi:hypothetical protein